MGNRDRQKKEKKKPKQPKNPAPSVRTDHPGPKQKIS